MRAISVIVLLLLTFPGNGQTIYHDADEKTILLTDGSGRLQLTIDYSHGCRVGSVRVNGSEKMSSRGAFTSARTAAGSFTSLQSSDVKIKTGKNTLTAGNIAFGDEGLLLNETWIFSTFGDRITWKIQRHYNTGGFLENMGMPEWHFEGNNSWKGGILNTGGVVWCKYLDDPGDIYGVHTGGVTFWETANGDGLRIRGSTSDRHVASSFSLSEEGNFRFIQYLTDSILQPRYNLNRFIERKGDIFAPFGISRGMSEITLELSYVDYEKEYDRGKLAGIDALAVRELMNTTARYGVVDKNIMGGNGWLTNWKCLHEPFFAQIGLALNDQDYLTNFASTLDQERDLAIEPDGRVLARWHNVPEAKESNYNFRTGYYDCPWGYTIDAQPSQVINTVELFRQTGDLQWLKSHKANCEKVLDWLIRRDSNGNGIFEMLNDNTAENKCSDWIDVVWASFENSFVNAMMHEALILWAECENILGDRQKSEYYSSVAARLKTSFNMHVKDGGFWLPEKKQYIYWRDKDGSIHGDNLVTPVNFAAIAFGICDDPDRIKKILENIESVTAAENLFHWPLCFESFRLEEVHPRPNWPFPNYENGDIFPTWGYLGIRSYVKYDRSLALKYVKNLLRQYNTDGLSSQRFSRTTQQGIGDDILAGICTTITALYSDIYGISPEWNRMGLMPHMTEELNGTRFRYTLRNIEYMVSLDEGRYELSAGRFTAASSHDFGINPEGSTLVFYPENREEPGLYVKLQGKDDMKIFFDWSADRMSWTTENEGMCRFTVAGLNPGHRYRLLTGNAMKTFVAGRDGSYGFSHNCTSGLKFVISIL